MAEEEFEHGQLPLGTPGQRLRHAREAAGLSLADVSDRTKISKRYLAAIEEDRFADLAGRTYAVGFSRAYARAVGIGEVAIADAVRDQLASEEEHWPAPKLDTFEPGDPARVPPSGLAWAAVLGALAVIVLLFIFWRSFIDPAGSLPDLTRDAAPRTETNAKAKSAATASSVMPSGPVVFTALEPGIWVRFYDASGNRLFERQMDLGESYTVPADADDPMIRTARPDALKITIGGRMVPGLGDAPLTISDVPVSAPALLARGKKPPEGETAVPAPAGSAVSPSPAASAAAASPAPRHAAPAARLPGPDPSRTQGPVPALAPSQPAAARSQAAAVPSTAPRSDAQAVPSAQQTSTDLE